MNDGRVSASTPVRSEPSATGIQTRVPPSRSAVTMACSVNARPAIEVATGSFGGLDARAQRAGIGSSVV